MKNCIFKSSRLSYRKILKDDFPLFYELHSNEEAMRYSYQDMYTSEEKLLIQFNEILEESKSVYFLAINNETNLEIGIIGYNIELNKPYGMIIDIGYIIKPIFWNQGYGTEMGKAIIHYTFHIPQIHKIIARCNSENTASKNLLGKIGMKKEGIGRKARYKNGKWVDEIQYGLLREEWSGL